MLREGGEFEDVVLTDTLLNPFPSSPIVRDNYFTARFHYRFLFP